MSPSERLQAVWAYWISHVQKMTFGVEMVVEKR